MVKEGCAIDVVKKKGAPVDVVKKECAYIRGQRKVRHRRGQKRVPLLTWSNKSAPIYVVKEGRLYTWSKKGAPVDVVEKECAYIRGQRRVRH